MLNEDSFNLDGQVSLASLQGEAEHMEAEIVSNPQDLQEMSLAVQKQNKEALSKLKSRVMISLDQRKLNQAQKLLTGMETIGDMFSDPDIIDKVKENTSTAMDMKFLAEAYAKMLDSQQKLMRLDSVDGSGTAAKLKLAVQFQGSTGNTVSTVIQAEG